MLDELFAGTDELFGGDTPSINKGKITPIL